MANPALTDRRIRSLSLTEVDGRRMTRAGVAKALGVFAVFGLIGAGFGWHAGAGGAVTQRTETFIFLSIITAFILSIFIIRVPNLARTLGVVYAILEGFAVGVISAAYNAQYHGIVAKALGATLGVALCVWFLYGTGVIKVTDRLRRVIYMAVLGALAFYLVEILVSVFKGPDLIGTGGPLGIVISLVLAAIAAATFLLDFDRIDRLIAANASEEYNWYGAFGLLISFIWLYLEILSLLGQRGGNITRR